MAKDELNKKWNSPCWIYFFIQTPVHRFTLAAFNLRCARLVPIKLQCYTERIKLLQLLTVLGALNKVS